MKRNNVLKIGIENGEIIMSYSVLNCYFLEQKDKTENQCYFESKQIKQIKKPWDKWILNFKTSEMNWWVLIYS